VRQHAARHAQETLMKKIIVVYGLISGAVATVMMLATMLVADRIGFERGAYIGYTTIVLSLLLVPAGVKTYRDHYGDGQITFLRALGIGLAITVISCLCYVVAWEVLYYNFMPDFFDKYGAHMVAKLQASGASQAAMQKALADAQRYKQMYANPLMNGAMTFMEPFPVGLVIALVSAGVLRRTAGPQAASQAQVAV
jgi:hypothetical protein